MFNPNNIDPETQISDPVSMKTKILIAVGAVVLILISYFLWEYLKTHDIRPQKPVSIDSRMQSLETLRAEKKANEKQIDELQKKNYVLDWKIIPLKCWIYSEVWAKDTWEAECRESHEEQKEKILSQEEEQVDSAVVPDYQ